MPWLGFAAVGVGGGAGLLAASSWAGFFAGVAAAAASALVAWVATRPLQADLETLSTAARGLARELSSDPTSRNADTRKLAREVNELAEQTRKLSLAHDTLTAVLDRMPDGVWITSADGTIVRHNAALQELLYPMTTLTGQRPIAVLRSTQLQEAVVRACEAAEPARLEVPVEGLRPRTLAVDVVPLGKELGGSAAVFRDVSELRRLEKVRQDFVANVSHELATPITAIRGYAETLREGALRDPENAPQMVEIIHRQSERLSELVRDLLELSRLDAKEQKLQVEPVALAEVAARAAEAVRPKASSKGITLELSVPTELVAQADARGIEQVLLNLLDNAVKYTPRGGRVEVRGQTADGRCAVSVRDTGVGIEAKHLPRVFERFYRVDKGRSRDMGGTGLGLSIVKNLMTAMEGDVRVESIPGKGTTFTVTVPTQTG